MHSEPAAFDAAFTPLSKLALGCSLLGSPPDSLSDPRSNPQNPLKSPNPTKSPVGWRLANEWVLYRTCSKEVAEGLGEWAWNYRVDWQTDSDSDGDHWMDNIAHGGGGGGVGVGGGVN